METKSPKTKKTS